MAGDIDDKEVLDAALIAAAQAVEHYEMTRYGTLVAWAKQLGRNDCASVLEQNLADEKATDAMLTKLAESKVNRAAAAGRSRRKEPAHRHGGPECDGARRSRDGRNLGGFGNGHPPRHYRARCLGVATRHDLADGAEAEI